MIEHKTIAKLGWSLPLSIVIITSTIKQEGFVYKYGTRVAFNYPGVNPGHTMVKAVLSSVEPHFNKKGTSV